MSISSNSIINLLTEILSYTTSCVSLGFLEVKHFFLESIEFNEGVKGINSVDVSSLIFCLLVLEGGVEIIDLFVCEVEFLNKFGLDESLHDL